MVADTPYFALTDEHGNFAIESVPAGSYEVDVWHERLGWRRQQLSLIRDALVSLDVVYGIDQVSR